MHERDRFAFRKIPPPTGGNRPQPEADFAHSQVTIFISAELHDPSLANEQENVQHRTQQTIALIFFCATLLFC